MPLTIEVHSDSRDVFAEFSLHPIFFTCAFDPLNHCCCRVDLDSYFVWLARNVANFCGDQSSWYDLQLCDASCLIQINAISPVIFTDVLKEVIDEACFFCVLHVAGDFSPGETLPGLCLREVFALNVRF